MVQHHPSCQQPALLWGHDLLVNTAFVSWLSSNTHRWRPAAFRKFPTIDKKGLSENQARSKIYTDLNRSKTWPIIFIIQMMFSTIEAALGGRLLFGLKSSFNLLLNMLRCKSPGWKPEVYGLFSLLFFSALFINVRASIDTVQIF